MGTAEIQELGTVAIGEQTEVADADKTSGQNMQEKTAEKFVDIESHGTSLVIMGVVSPAKADSTFGHGNEARVRDGDAVSVTGEIGQDLSRSGKGSLGVNHPVALGSRAQQSGERGWGLERSQLAGEGELVVSKCSL
jgi:hypothetical protein